MTRECALLMLLSTSWIAAAPAGRVLDLQDLPVPAVRVTVADSAGRVVCETKTGEDGAWSCADEALLPLVLTITGEQWERLIYEIKSIDEPEIVRVRPARLLRSAQDFLSVVSRHEE